MLQIVLRGSMMQFLKKVMKMHRKVVRKNESVSNTCFSNSLFLFFCLSLFICLSLITLNKSWTKIENNFETHIIWNESVKRTIFDLFQLCCYSGDGNILYEGQQRSTPHSCEEQVECLGRLQLPNSGPRRLTRGNLAQRLTTTNFWWCPCCR